MIKHLKLIRLPSPANEFMCRQGTAFKVQAVLSLPSILLAVGPFSVSSTCANTLKVVQEYVDSLGPLLSLLFLSQKYACPNHYCKLRLVEVVAFLTLLTLKLSLPLTMPVGVSIASHSKSNESLLAVAVKLLVLRACLALAKSLFQQSSAGKRGHERNPKQKCHILPLVLPEVLWGFKHKCFSHYCIT